MSERSSVLFEDDFFTLAPCKSHPVPGYLILSSKTPIASLGALPTEHAAHLGSLLPRVVRAIEAAVETDRVYVLSFGESEGAFHIHLFPRTRWVLEAFRQEEGHSNGPVDGPALFEWVCRRLCLGYSFPNSIVPARETCERIRSLLNPGSSSRRESGVNLQAERLETHPGNKA